MTVLPRKRGPKLVAVSTPEANAGHAIAEALASVAASIDRQTDEATAMRLQQKSMHDFFTKADIALDCAGARIRKWGPWLLGSIPFVISFINGVSPQAAKLIQVLVDTAGKIQP